MKRFNYPTETTLIQSEIMSTNPDYIVVDENAVRVKAKATLEDNTDGNENDDITLEDFRKKVVERLTALAAANNGLTQEQLEALAALSNVNDYVKKSGDPQKVESEITFKDGIYITDNTDTAAISLDEKFDIFTAGLGLNVDEGVYAAKFVKDGGTNTEVLLADGTTKALSEIGGNGGGYNKPADGIPASDMTAEVQALLAKADSAVQPETNKGLSTNDFTDAYKAVLDGAGNYATQTWVNGRIEEINATGSTQVNSDWNAVNGVAQILNKPTLGSLASLNGIDYSQLTGNLERDLSSALGQNGTIDAMLTDVNALKSTVNATGNNALVKASQLSSYLTTTTASNTYVTKTHAEDTYATQTDFANLSSTVTNKQDKITSSNKLNASLISGLTDNNTTYKFTIGSTTKGDTTNGVDLGTLKSESAVDNGTTLSLVTTGEKARWNAKSNFDGTWASLSGKPATNGVVANGNTGLVDGGVVYNALQSYALSSSIPTKVSQLANDSGFTTNAGTITAVKMNNATVASSGIADLGNVVKTIKLNGSNLSGTSTGLVDLGNLATTNQIPTIDSALSGTSTNAVQNKVINAALAGKADQSDLEQKANASDLTALSTTVSGKQDKITTSNAASVRTTLGLGTLATQNSIAAATTSAAGLMSATDKAKLDGIASGATANSGTITGVTVNGGTLLSHTNGVVNIPGTLIAEALGGTGNSGLATVAWSGDYNDLDNKPTIPNTSNFITKSNNSDAYSWLLRANGQSITMEDLATEIGVGLFSGETQSGTGKNGIVAAPNKVGDYEGDIKYLSASGDWIYSKASGGDLVSKYGLTTDRTDSGTYQLYYETPLERLAIYTTTSSGRRWIDSDGYTIRRCILVGTTLSWQHVCKRKGTLKEMPRYLDLDPTYDQGYPFYLTPINKQLYAKITVETSKIYTNGSWKSINIYNYRWTDSEGRTWVISWHHDGMSSSQLYAYDSTNKRYNTDNNILAIDSSFDKLVDTETTTLSNITISEYAGLSTDYSNCRTGLFTKDDLGRYFAKGSFYSDLYMLSGILVTDSNIDDNHTNNGVYSRTYKYTLINVNGDDDIQYTLTISHLKK